jgi:flagellar export protein FliJ
MSGSAWIMPSPEWKKLPRIAKVPKFKFSLETLLRHREDIEQRERDELLRLTYKYQVELVNRNGLTAKYQETMEEIALKCARNAIDEELSWFYLYLNRLTHEIKECEARLTKLKSEVQAQKEAVVEASKKRKTLASLKAKKEKEFTFAMEKQEQKEIDDLVVTRYVMPESLHQASTEVLNPGTAAKHE